ARKDRHRTAPKSRAAGMCIPGGPESRNTVPSPSGQVRKAPGPEANLVHKGCSSHLRSAGKVLPGNLEIHHDRHFEQVTIVMDTCSNTVIKGRDALLRVTGIVRESAQKSHIG